MKQTAVEFLFEQVNDLDWRNLIGEKKIEIFEQAKAMESEQRDDIINQIDMELALIEDYARGEAGEEITKLRKYIDKIYRK